MWTSVAIAALAGLVVGGVAGLLAAIAQMQSKGLRNAYRQRRGEPPYRDGLRAPWHIPCAVVGMIASGVLAIWWPVPRAIAAGSLPLPGLLFVGFLAAAVGWLIKLRRG